MCSTDKYNKINLGSDNLILIHNSNAVHDRKAGTQEERSFSIFLTITIIIIIIIC